MTQAIRKNKIMQFIATWMELKAIKLNGVNLNKRNRYRMIFHTAV